MEQMRDRKCQHRFFLLHLHRFALLYTYVLHRIHYENLPIQTYRKFHLQKLKIFS